MVRRLAPVFLCLTILVTSCGGPGPAPVPRRPQPAEGPAKAKSRQRTDCEPSDPARLLPVVPYEERSIDEAENLAQEGYAMLKSAESRSVEKIEQEQLVSDAIDRFITALYADPYNVQATYNLAAAYARIKRAQCSINLLARMIPLRKLRTFKDDVERKLDRLLGRKEFDGALDPDFFTMRNDPRFRELVKEFDPGALHRQSQ